MSFFSQQGDDSNLQYDDAGFLYFIASTLIVATIIIISFAIRDLIKLNIHDKNKINKANIFHQKLANLQKQKRRRVFNKAFIVKVVLIVALISLTYLVYDYSAQAQNKLKGFDPYEILGVSKDASLRDIKKAYRKLALEFHPDKNQGNPEAQAKFILISKSYECFTDQTKKDNCFKFGNPDGTNSFRIGIGLPNFFVKAQYKWFTLPIVLSIFLLIIPAFMLQWSNRSKMVDPYGISIAGYNALFRCVNTALTKQSALYLLSSFKQLSQDAGMGAISVQNKGRLFQQLRIHPQYKNDVIQQFNDNELQVFWEIYKYIAAIEQFSFPQFRQQLQAMMAKLFVALIPFTIKQKEGDILYGNPDWKIIYLGSLPLQLLIDFQRIYYNRSFYRSTPADWSQAVELAPQDIQVVNARPIINIYQLLKSDDLDRYLGLFAENRRQILKKEFNNIPIYNLQMKLQVADKDVKEITVQDFAHLCFRVSKIRPTSNYCFIKNYPYPKKQKLYILIILNTNLFYFKDINFEARQSYYIGKLPFRINAPLNCKVQAYVLSDCYYGLDIAHTLDFSVHSVPQQIKNMKVVFHPDDLQLQKHNKTFFQQMMDLQLDPQQGMLSDSDDEQK